MNRAFLQFLALWAVSSFSAMGTEKGGVYRLHTVEVKADGRDYGQGTCVAIEADDRRQHFVTVKHNLGPSLQVENDQGFFAVEVVAEWDCDPEPIVLLRQKKPAGRWREYPVAIGGLRVGEKAFIAGFPGNQFVGRTSQVIEIDKDITLSGTSKHGMSGGAILTESGHVAGLVTGRSLQRPVTFACDLVKCWSENKKPRGEPVQWRCYRGRCYPSYPMPMRAMPPQAYPQQPIVRRPVERPRPEPLPVSQSSPPTVDMDDVLRDVKIEVVSWLESNKDQLRGSDGQDGTSPKIDLNQLADVITSKYADRIKGRDGTNGATPVIDYYRLSETVVRNFGEELRGPAGKRGLVGVPDNEDIRNWLIGATADPEAQATLAKVFADLIASDPRVAELIQRLESLESRESSSAEIDARFSELENRDVPFIVLNSDGSTFSKGTRKAFDPITIKLRPPEEM